MKTLRATGRWITVALAALALLGTLLGFAGATLAQTGGGYDLSWFSLDGGGGYSVAGGYTLGGTIGQPDAGTLSGGNYTLAGGFWTGAAAAPDHFIYLPLVLR